MSSRIQYFTDLLQDCDTAAAEAMPQNNDADHVRLVTAMILSDGLNGVRRALLDLADATRKQGGQP